MPKICRVTRALVAGTAVLVLPHVETRAEIPPRGYYHQQKEAPEAIQMRVTAVHSNVIPELTVHMVEATVVCVLRSRSGLTPGTKITITYINHIPGRNLGPSQIPKL